MVGGYGLFEDAELRAKMAGKVTATSTVAEKCNGTRLRSYRMGRGGEDLIVFVATGNKLLLLSGAGLDLDEFF